MIFSDELQVISDVNITKSHIFAVSATSHTSKQIESRQVSSIELIMMISRNIFEQITQSKSRQKAADNLIITSSEKSQEIS